MVDLTHYPITPADEWIEFERTWKRPDPPPAATILELRKAANLRTAALFAEVLGRPKKGLEVNDYNVPTTNGVDVAVRLYKPTNHYCREANNPLPLFVSFHGGGFHLGSLETEDPHCRQVALTTGSAVLNVNYRHTPEWTFPAPVNDAWAAYVWVVRNSSTLGIDAGRIFIGGVSAGATLAISVALQALKQELVPRVQGLILGTPSTVHPDVFPLELLRGGISSLQINANAPFINQAKLRALADLYQPEPTHPACSPLIIPTKEFIGLCPVSFHIAGLDPLRDEGLLFEDKLRDAGVNTTLHVYPGVPHAFMSLPTLPSAEKWRQEMQRDLKAWIDTK